MTQIHTEIIIQDTGFSVINTTFSVNAKMDSHLRGNDIVDRMSFP
jgi:hypothetical protein